MRGPGQEKWSLWPSWHAICVLEAHRRIYQEATAGKLTLSKKAVLSMAREECLPKNHFNPRCHPHCFRWKTHPERLNSMKNMSHSELSRRRLVPAKRTKAAVDVSEPLAAPQGQEPEVAKTVEEADNLSANPAAVEISECEEVVDDSTV